MNNNQVRDMIDNYFESEYHPCDKIYTQPSSGKSLFLGDISSALDLQFISRERIVTVVTAAVGMEHVQYDHTVNHIVYPLLDMKSENINKYFMQFYDLIERELHRGNILVHCAAGISRSSTLIIAYLMKKKCMGFKDAIAFVRQARPNVCPNLGFERQLKEYQHILNRQAQRGFERRLGSKTSEERKHVPSPNRPKVLPEIAIMGRTQLKPKLLQLFAVEPINRQDQQFSRHSTKQRNAQDAEFYGTKKIVFKPIKSKSIPQKPIQHPFNFMPLYINQSEHVERINGGSLPIKRIQEIMYSQNVHIMEPSNNNKKAVTERNIRLKQLNKLANF